VVSTLKLTKIQIPNSDSDVLSFNSSTGVMTFHKDIKGEGTANTNLQQGLAKYWIDYNKSSNNNVEDSLNSSSITDAATGDTTLNFTNNMASTAYSAIVDNTNNTVGNSNIYVHSVKTNHKNTTNFSSFLGYDPGTVTGVDANNQSGLAHGDLA